MFGIFSSALNVVLGFIFRSTIVKFGVLFGLFFVIQEFVSVLGGFLPDPSSLSGALGSISSDIWYFMDLAAFTNGSSLVITAMVYRFLIRRIPIIG